MSIILLPLLNVLRAVIDIYWWIVISSVVMSWLISFQVVNRNNNFVIMLEDFLFRATDPILSKVRRILPVTTSQVDFSPLVVLLCVWFIQEVILQLIRYLH